MASLNLWLRKLDLPSTHMLLYCTDSIRKPRFLCVRSHPCGSREFTLGWIRSGLVSDYFPTEME